jgi:signal peptidase
MLVVCLILVLWPASFGGRFGMVMVAGNSMEPTLNLGDAVVTWRESVDIGDVILFRVPEGETGEGNPVIHRVIGGDATGWITQGDNSNRPDKWEPASSDVMGVAKLWIPMGGRVLAVMKSWLFIAALAGLVAALVIWPDAEDEKPSPQRGRHRT